MTPEGAYRVREEHLSRVAQAAMNRKKADQEWKDVVGSARKAGIGDAEIQQVTATAERMVR